MGLYPQNAKRDRLDLGLRLYCRLLWVSHCGSSKHSNFKHIPPHHASTSDDQQQKKKIMSIKKLKTDTFTMNTIVKKRRRHVGEHQTVCGLWTPQQVGIKCAFLSTRFTRKEKNNEKEERDMTRVMECVEAIAEMDSEEVLGSSDQQSLREG